MSNNSVDRRATLGNLVKNATEAGVHIGGMSVLAFGAIKLAEAVVRAGQASTPEFSLTKAVFGAGLIGLIDGLAIYLNTGTWRPVLSSPKK